MFTFSEMFALVESESSFGAYVCHRRPGGSRATSDLVDQKLDEKMYKKSDPIFQCTTPSTGKRLGEVVVGTLYHCVCCTSLSEISAHLPAFKEEFKAEHPKLAAAVDQLPDAIVGDRAPATVQKYAGAFDRWSAWAKKHGLASLPANPAGVAVYLL